MHHLGLSLGTVISYAKKYQDSLLTRRYRFLKQLMSLNELWIAYKEYGPGIFLFSNYVWSSQQNLELTRELKKRDARNIIIHGGPSVPVNKNEAFQFLKSQKHVDIGVRGEGELSLAEVLLCLSTAELDGHKIFDGMRDIKGIYFMDREDGFIFTEQRERIQNLGSLPSPYLNGDFNLAGVNYGSAVMETNRGCPYHCAFCYWGSTVGHKIYHFPLERVCAEIKWIGQHKIPIVWISDSNFGMFDRDKEIALALVEAKRTYGYPKQMIANYSKISTQRIVDIVHLLNRGGIFAEGIIGMQSADETVLACIHRRNISLESTKKLIHMFKKRNLPITVELMFGLPGSTVKSLKKDLQLCFDFAINTRDYQTYVLPNSLMADEDYRKKYQIKCDADGFIKSCFSYTPKDFREMNRIVTAYRLSEGYGILKYVLRFVQWEYQINAIEVIHRLSILIEKPSSRFPLISKLFRFFSKGFLPYPDEGWFEFYREVGFFLRLKYQLPIDPLLETALRVQQHVMPGFGRKLPEKLKLKHDFVSYFRDNAFSSGTRFKRLSQYSEGELIITDPNNICGLIWNGNSQIITIGSHYNYWELESALSDNQALLLNLCDDWIL